MTCARASFAVALLAAALGCGSSSPSASPDGGAAAGPDGGGAAGTTGSAAGPHGCTNIQASCSSNDGMTCEELAGYDAASIANFKKNCNHPNQVLSDQPCDKTGTVGGCEVAVNGVCGVIWSFTPITLSELQMGCVGQYQLVVQP